MGKELAKVIPLFKNQPLDIPVVTKEDIEEFVQKFESSIDNNAENESETLFEYVERCMEYAFVQETHEGEMKVVVLPVEDMDAMMEGITEASSELERYRKALQRISEHSNERSSKIAKKALGK